MPNETPTTHAAAKPRKSGSSLVSLEDAKREIEPLVDVRVACALLGVQPRTLRAWLQSGLIESVRLSRRAVRLKLSSVRSFIESRTTTAR